MKSQHHLLEKLMSLESLTILADIYNEAISHKKAVEMIKTGQCGQFNHILMECFLEMSDEIESKLQS